jgi:O-antigen ligase
MYVPFMLLRTAPSHIDLDPRVLTAWLSAGALLAVAALLYLVFNKPILYSALVVGAPLAVYVVLHPRVALVQFIFAIFIGYEIAPTVSLNLVDISTLLLIAAAAVDFLMSSRMPQRIPRLTWNLAYMIAALVICGVLGYWPELVMRRVVGLSMLIILLWSVYRLCDRMTIRKLIDWFLIASVINSCHVLLMFVKSGGAERSFGLTGVVFDDIAMVATPMALAMYIGSKGRKSTLYLGATFACLGGLIATQTRLSIMFGLAAMGFVILTACFRTLRGDETGVFRRAIRRKIGLLAVVATGFLLLVIAANPNLFSAVLGRFEQLTGDPFQGYSTASYRVSLWKRALVAWLDHPVFGVGPGGFVRLDELYPAVHISPDYRFLKGLSPHNMFLEYLSTTGIIGGAGILALIANKFRLARKAWRHHAIDSFGPSLALYVWAALFVATTLIEAGWLWRPPSLLMVFLAALVSRQYSDTFDSPPQPVSA